MEEEKFNRKEISMIYLHHIIFLGRIFEDGDSSRELTRGDEILGVEKFDAGDGDLLVLKTKVFTHEL